MCTQPLCLEWKNSLKCIQMMQTPVKERTPFPPNPLLWFSEDRFRSCTSEKEALDINTVTEHQILQLVLITEKLFSSCGLARGNFLTGASCTTTGTGHVQMSSIGAELCSRFSHQLCSRGRAGCLVVSTWWESACVTCSSHSWCEVLQGAGARTNIRKFYTPTATRGDCSTDRHAGNASQLHHQQPQHQRAERLSILGCTRIDHAQELHQVSLQNRQCQLY